MATNETGEMAVRMRDLLTTPNFVPRFRFSFGQHKEHELILWPLSKGRNSANH